ncbi:MAG: site-specific DNA-methyltransferase, partial [Candidatus Berkelbacteria bacterium]|nr:site-specific DNA-methyltransferase [Candidatus Berkelbacteria bacterium]
KLVETCILASTKEGDLVFDPFMGSGTTALVACKLGRNFTGVELVEKYKDMAEERVAPYLQQSKLILPSKTLSNA